MKPLLYITLSLLLSSIANAQMNCSKILESYNIISLNQSAEELDLEAVNAEHLAALEAERVELLDELLKGFTPQKREIIDLKYIDGKTHSEIADELGISTSRVSTLAREIEKKFADFRRFKERRSAEVITQEFLDNQINTAKLNYSSKFQSLKRILHRHFDTYDVSRNLHGFSSLLIFLVEDLNPQVKNTKEVINTLLKEIDQRNQITGSSSEEIEASYTELSSRLREDAYALIEQLPEALNINIASADIEKLQKAFKSVFTGHYSTDY